ncbi:uDP-N-acetylglucosamine enolpyruvyl transferase [Clostridium sp. CAG:448]|nr:uDP-N-acetylglucosamine enolpyruvyl transferase [Clostridium sp. CAG:448]
MLRSGKRFQLFVGGIVVRLFARIFFTDIGNVNDRLARQKRRVVKIGFFILGQGNRACALSGFQRGIQTLEYLQCSGKRFVIFHILACALHAAFQCFHVCENQFQVDGFQVAYRVDGSLYMDDVRILKAAYNVQNGVYLADMRKKFIPEPFTLGGAADQSRNVDKFDNGRGEFFRIVHLCQDIQTVVRYRNNTHVRFNGAEGVIGGFRTGAGQCVEQGAFSHVGKPDDTKFHKIISVCSDIDHAFRVLPSII